MKSSETAGERSGMPRKRRAKTFIWMPLLLGLCLAARTPAKAEEATWEYSVQVSATVQSSPAQIHLTWPQDTVYTPSSYTVYRKALSDTSWGAGTVLPGTNTNYIDNNVANGSAYEYQIVKVTPA